MLGSISLPIIVGSKIIQTILQVIEGGITQYNIILGRPWIRDMKCVPLTYHNFLKYIHEGMVHCMPGDANPYSYNNGAYLSKEMALPSTYYFIMPIPLEKPLVVKIGKITLPLSSPKE